MINYRVKNVTTGQVYNLSQDELLNEINRDRSEHFSSYRADDLETESMIIDALSLTELELLEVL